jgi:hypothetical protein
MMTLRNMRARAVTAGAMVVLSACGGVVIVDGTASNGEGGAGGFAGTTTGAFGMTSTSGVGGFPGSASAGSTGTGSGPVTCDSYCSSIMKNCKDATAQYSSLESCKATCLSFPVGQIGDKVGNSLSCRVNHGVVAMKDPKAECFNAGPTGGDKDASDGTGPVCGDVCEAFCTLAQKTCTGANQVFPDMAACQADCKKFKPIIVPYSTADAFGDNFGCRMYHLTVAAKDDIAAIMHCAHIRLISDPCKS